MIFILKILCFQSIGNALKFLNEKKLSMFTYPDKESEPINNIGKDMSIEIAEEDLKT